MLAVGLCTCWLTSPQNLNLRLIVHQRGNGKGATRRVLLSLWRQSSQQQRVSRGSRLSLCWPSEKASRLGEKEEKTGKATSLACPEP